MRNKHVKAAIVAVVLTGPLPFTKASAQFGLPGLPQVVIDPSAIGKLVSQLNQQLQQIQMQRNQLQQQVLSMRKLANPPLRQISGAMSQLDQLMRDGQSLAYQVRNLQSEFNATFPVTRAIIDWPTEERAQAQRTIATLRASLNAASVQASSFTTGLDRIAQMKSAVGAVQGHEAALELQNSASIFTAEELVLLRQALMSQANAQAVYYAHQINQTAQRDETIRAQLSADAIRGAVRPEVSLRVVP
ncbi:MAG: hypothetical protein ABJF01_22955 [bacterium]